MAKESKYSFINKDKMESMQDYVVYALLEPDSHKVRYIGKTHWPTHRMGGHINKAPNGDGPKDEWIVSLAERDEQPIMKILQICAGKVEYDFMEVLWFRYYEQRGADLLNIQKFDTWQYRTVNELIDSINLDLAPEDLRTCAIDAFYSHQLRATAEEILEQKSEALSKNYGVPIDGHTS